MSSPPSVSLSFVFVLFCRLFSYFSVVHSSFSFVYLHFSVYHQFVLFCRPFILFSRLFALFCRPFVVFRHHPFLYFSVVHSYFLPPFSVVHSYCSVVLSYSPIIRSFVSVVHSFFCRRPFLHLISVVLLSCPFAFSVFISYFSVVRFRILFSFTNYPANFFCVFSSSNQTLRHTLVSAQIRSYFTVCSAPDLSLLSQSFASIVVCFSIHMLGIKNIFSTFKCICIY